MAPGQGAVGRSGAAAGRLCSITRQVSTAEGLPAAAVPQAVRDYSQLCLLHPLGCIRNPFLKREVRTIQDGCHLGGFHAMAFRQGAAGSLLKTSGFQHRLRHDPLETTKAKT